MFRRRRQYKYTRSKTPKRPKRQGYETSESRKWRKIKRVAVAVVVMVALYGAAQALASKQRAEEHQQQLDQPGAKLQRTAKYGRSRDGSVEFITSQANPELLERVEIRKSQEPIQHYRIFFDRKECEREKKNNPDMQKLPVPPEYSIALCVDDDLAKSFQLELNDLRDQPPPKPLNEKWWTPFAKAGKYLYNKLHR